MNLQALVTDNITELLVQIIKFTYTRQKILTRNINNVHGGDFVPKDLPVDEFSELLSNAIDEHTRSGRLLLRDSANIKFGTGGSFEAEPITDRRAKELLELSRDQYIELQINKLLENSLNQRLAAELLRQKQSMIC